MVVLFDDQNLVNDLGPRIAFQATISMEYMLYSILHHTVDRRTPVDPCTYEMYETL